MNKINRKCSLIRMNVYDNRNIYVIFIFNMEWESKPNIYKNVWQTFATGFSLVISQFYDKYKYQ